MMENILWINTIALFMSPLLAVGLAYLSGKANARLQIKNQVFITLLIYRGSGATPEKTNCLNSLYAVYSRHPKVIRLWEEYHQLLQVSNPNELQWKQAEHKYTQLLSEMARVLGYKDIEQVALDKFYFPQGAVEANALRHDLDTELLRVLKNTNSIQVNPRIES